MIRYEMNHNLNQVERNVYGILDFMGDLGGFVEAIFFLSAVLLFLVQFQPLNQTLVRSLYSHSPGDSGSQSENTN